MTALKRVSIVGAAAAVTLTLFPAATAGAGGSGSCFHHRDRERAFAHKINSARSHRGRHRLELDKQLSKVARHQAWAMDRKNRLYHTPSRKLRYRVTRWNLLGENVGVGRSVKSLHRAFMASPGHRENVMYSRFQHVGVGVRKDPDRIWVAIVFEAARNPGTRMRYCPR